MSQAALGPERQERKMEMPAIGNQDDLIWMQPGPDSAPGDVGDFSIGEVCRRFGVTARALRFYESKKLLIPIRRGKGRHYRPEHCARLAMILKGKALGFTLGEIALILASDSGHGSGSFALTPEKCLEQIGWLIRERAKIDAAIGELQAMTQEHKPVVSARVS